MEVGIGLPNAVPGVEGVEQLLEWARRAEARGFSSVGTIDRLVYPNYEPLVALAAAAAVTERTGSQRRRSSSLRIAPTQRSLSPSRPLTLDDLSNGRLVLGAALSEGREDDYAASGVDIHPTRGRRFDEMPPSGRGHSWAGEAFGTAGAIGPPARNWRPRAHDRRQRRRGVPARGDVRGVGWTGRLGTPEDFTQGAAKVRRGLARGRARWDAADGWALAYFALGDRGEGGRRALPQGLLRLALAVTSRR